MIDLSQIDANTLVDGNQAFNFIGAPRSATPPASFASRISALGGPIWLVQGDTNGDGVSDFEVVLVISPADPITAGDFVL